MLEPATAREAWVALEPQGVAGPLGHEGRARIGLANVGLECQGRQVEGLEPRLGSTAGIEKQAFLELLEEGAEEGVAACREGWQTAEPEA